MSKQELPRTLGVLDASAIVIGIVIGSGIFLLPNLIARVLPSAQSILAVWIVSGGLSFFGALAYAELGAMMPATGGQYVYLREAYGPLSAFVSGWTFMLAVLSGGTAWLTVTFSIYLAQFLPLRPAMSKLVSLSLLAVLSAVNYGVDLSERALQIICRLADLLWIAEQKSSREFVAEPEAGLVGDSVEIPIRTQFATDGWVATGDCSADHGFQVDLWPRCERDPPFAEPLERARGP